MSTRNGNVGMKSKLQAGGAMSDQRRQSCQFSLVSDKGRNQVSQQTTRKLNIFILRSTTLSLMLLLMMMKIMSIPRSTSLSSPWTVSIQLKQPRRLSQSKYKTLFLKTQFVSFIWFISFQRYCGPNLELSPFTTLLRICSH